MSARARHDFEAALRPAPGLGRQISQMRASGYESPIEVTLAARLCSVLAPGVTLTPQVWMTTPEGRYRPDLLLHTPGENGGCGRSTVLEADGEAFHQDFFRDVARDEALLATGLIDGILRLGGDQIYSRPWDAVWLVHLVHPGALSVRGRALCRRLASPGALQLDRPGCGEMLNVYSELPGREPRMFGAYWRVPRR